jgi:hypothetical protein
MDDFKPFWLADNMARCPNLADFRNREAQCGFRWEIDMKKPGHASATGFCPEPKGPDLNLSGEDCFA